ncbi:hypothetical protein GCM10010357_02220 [Streptomyces luteireticuli]|uniref:Uncharacterized protein n=1 Tax=Streptomyces luteireticuli TaxID=173858 RepID=A0ABN0Y7B1_9ACTN
MEAGAAEGGAEGGVVDGDDGPEAGLAVLAEHDLLMTAEVRAEEGVQHALGFGGGTYVSHGGDSICLAVVALRGWRRARLARE